MNLGTGKICTLATFNTASTLHRLKTKLTQKLHDNTIKFTLFLTFNPKIPANIRKFAGQCRQIHPT